MDDTNQIIQFNSGTKRSSRQFNFHLIDRGYLRRNTNNLEFGLTKYGYNNWRNGVKEGDKEFIIDVLNHAQAHLNAIVETVMDDVAPYEDDIAHVSFNMQILSYWFDLYTPYNAEYWRPIYKKRVEKFLTNQEKCSDALIQSTLPSSNRKS